MLRITKRYPEILQLQELLVEMKADKNRPEKIPAKRAAAPAKVRVAKQA